MREKELIQILTKASEDYYAGHPSMDDHDYDQLEKEYQALTGKPFRIIENVKGAKFKHEWAGKSCRAQSLDKTKDRALIIRKFSNFKNEGGRSDKAVGMWKLDGSTIQLYYKKNKATGMLDLIHAVTRGTDGEEGVIITHNAPYINGIVLHVGSPAENMVVRGEALMSYEEFERIQDTVVDDDYANPRNLATATIGMDNPEEGVKQRKIDFKAFSLYMLEDEAGNDLRSSEFSGRLAQLSDMGFTPVEHEVIDISDLDALMTKFEDAAVDYGYPVDGEVFTYEDIAWAETQPSTEHNPHISNGYALKWADETVDTDLRYIDWNTTRTGRINPIAIFDEVKLEGTKVTNATLHNISFIVEKDIRLGDKISVFKANKIIPKCEKSISAEARNTINLINELTEDEIREIYNIPSKCPCCGAPTVIDTNEDSGTKVLFCVNDECPAKKLDKLSLFCSKIGMNIDGLSSKKLSFLLNHGFIDSDFHSIYHMVNNAAENDGKVVTITRDFSTINLANAEGWGQKSVDNLVNAINKSRTCDFIHFIVAMGIPNISKGTAKDIKNYLSSIYGEYEEEFNSSFGDGSYDLMGMMAWLHFEKGHDWTNIENFGNIKASSLSNWLTNNFSWGTNEETDVERVLKELTFTDEKPAAATSESTSLSGLTFVITGTLNHFTNRNEFIALVESKGGKVAGSVSKKTSFLVNNDKMSESSKNKTAKSLGIEILSEDDFLNRFC